MKLPEKHIIMGVHITDRMQHVSQVQAILTEYGCLIKTRLGLHETSQEGCSPNGLLLLELLDDDAQAEAFAAALSQIEGVEVQQMVFRHP